MLAVLTVTLLLTAFAVTFGYWVVKLWYELVPAPIKHISPTSLVVAATPTNTPVEPSPTLTVEMPIKFLLNLAT